MGGSPRRYRLGCWNRCSSVSTIPHGSTGFWSEAASRSALDDEELARRFTCQYLDFSVEERRRLASYGINGNSTPAELAAVWQRIDRAVTSHPDLTGRVVDLFRTDLRYHYGCAARGSAKLSVIW
jgi:hypothetical protein